MPNTGREAQATTNHQQGDGSGAKQTVRRGDDDWEGTRGGKRGVEPPTQQRLRAGAACPHDAGGVHRHGGGAQGGGGHGARGRAAGTQGRQAGGRRRAALRCCAAACTRVAAGHVRIPV
jgi:hypothetical protein